MKLAFTICSNNYLALAITLGDSLVKHNPEVNFIIGLVDKKDTSSILFKEIKYEVLEIDKIINGEVLTKMVRNYNIIELNTAVKPFLFKHFFDLKTNYESIIYFDPDIEIFGSLNDLFVKQGKYNFIVTPHITSSSDGKMTPDDRNFIRTGIFNLGFLSMTRSKDANDFIEWWISKMIGGGAKSNVYFGLFYDQLWVNMIVAFFDSVLIERSVGYNCAPWNLHERILSEREGIYFVNDKYPLIFFHFSSFRINIPNFISAHVKCNLNDRNDLRKLYENYKHTLLGNGYEAFNKIKCFYKTRKIKSFIYYIKKIIIPILKKIIT
jgi:hypothetical protein